MAQHGGTVSLAGLVCDRATREPIIAVVTAVYGTRAVDHRRLSVGQTMTLRRI